MLDGECLQLFFFLFQNEIRVDIPPSHKFNAGLKLPGALDLALKLLVSVPQDPTRYLEEMGDARLTRLEEVVKSIMDQANLVILLLKVYVSWLWALYTNCHVSEESHSMYQMSL